MSTQQTPAESNDSSDNDETNYNARLQTYQRLGVEIGETTVAKGGGDTDKPRVVTTPLNNDIGRVNVTGRVTNTEIEQGSVGKLTLNVGNDYQMKVYAYNNSSDSPHPTDLKLIAEGTPVSLTLRPDVYGQNDTSVNGVYATPRIESLNTIEEETMWANLAEAAANTLNRISEFHPQVEQYEDDPTADGFDAEIGMWYANYGENALYSIETHAKSILENAKKAILNDESTGSQQENTQEEEEQTIRMLLEQYDIYNPAIETLSAEFDTPWEMFDCDTLGELNHVGRKTVDQIEQIESDMNP